MTRLWCIVLGVVLGGIVGSSQALAGTIVLGEAKSLPSPAATTQTSIEFYLDRTGADDGTPLSVGNFQVRVTLTGNGAGSLVKILGAADTSTHPQAYALDTKTVQAGTGAFGATLNLGSPISIADGGGLLKLNLELNAGASGLYTLAVQGGSGNTEFTSPSDFSTLLAVDASSGLLTVEVPEPTVGVLLLAALVASCLGVRTTNRPPCTHRMRTASC